jgi:hypothetical protein
MMYVVFEVCGLEGLVVANLNRCGWLSCFQRLVSC